LADQAKRQRRARPLFGSGANTEKRRGSGHWRYNIASGKVKILVY
jgi:hypothetical protein